MADNCGEADAVSKLAKASWQDRSRYNERFDPAAQPKESPAHLPDNAEYFEFKSSAALIPPTPSHHAEPSSWTAEFNSYNLPHAHFQQQQQQSALGHFPAEFERAFGMMAVAPNEPSWSQEFKSKSPPITEWSQEYVQHLSSHPNSADDWVSEYKAASASDDQNANENKEELRQAAQGILQNLSTDRDPKLERSRFVAYLRNLAGPETLQEHPLSASTDFSQWRDSYLKSISLLGGDKEWHDLGKTWEQYESTGYGYKDFAKNEFGSYHFSIPIGANPFRDTPEKQSRLIQAVSARNLQDTLLLLEAIVHENPSDGDAWSKLGHFQQANEIDAQAIPAFLRATTINPLDMDAWVGLAASCTNESCIPDALDALRNMLAFSPDHKDAARRLSRLDLKLFADVFEDCVANSALKQGRLAASILQNISGNHDRAIAHIKHISLADADWSIANRLGASLANSKKYEEALAVYDQLSSRGHNYPRVYYNRGISLMCMENYQDAARSFVQAINMQLPVDVVSGIREELLPSYTSVWEALRVTFDLMGSPVLSQLCDQRRLSEIASQLQD